MKHILLEGDGIRQLLSFLGFYLKRVVSWNLIKSGGPKLELTSLGCMQYDKFLSQHGGSSNAYTDQEFTCYHFEVINKCFRDALERWTNSLQLCNTFLIFDDRCMSQLRIYRHLQLGHYYGLELHDNPSPNSKVHKNDADFRSSLFLL